MCAAEGTPSPASKIPAMAFCSVCLDTVVDGEGRSTARLTCGHSFHLDCIGSAFNAKGRMQCPNCRGVEQGQWLYANACCLNEDSVEDILFEQETELYRTADVLLNHSPWCPYQGLYDHISLTFEELMNLGHGYAHSLQSSSQRRRICPYLVGVHNIPRHSSHTGNSISLRLHNFDSSSSHNISRGVSHVHQTRLGLSAHNGSWVPYGGSIRSYNHNGPNFHPNLSHQMFGILLESSQSTSIRFSEGTHAGGQRGQHIHNQVDQTMHRHSHPHTMSLVWNAQTRARHGEVIRTTLRQSHNYYVRRPQTSESTMHGHPSWVDPYTTQQQLSMSPYMDGVHWTVGPHVTYGMPAYWWAWVPFETNHRNMAIPTRVGQSGSASRSTSWVEGHA